MDFQLDAQSGFILVVSFGIKTKVAIIRSPFMLMVVFSLKLLTNWAHKKNANNGGFSLFYQVINCDLIYE